ncbi:hypothetical protein BKA80DRAFT_268698 [Phyllosticta citrichinensis]
MAILRTATRNGGRKQGRSVALVGVGHQLARTSQLACSKWRGGDKTEMETRRQGRRCWC